MPINAVSPTFGQISFRLTNQGDEARQHALKQTVLRTFKEKGLGPLTEPDTDREAVGVEINYDNGQRKNTIALSSTVGQGQLNRSELYDLPLLNAFRYEVGRAPFNPMSIQVKTLAAPFNTDEDLPGVLHGQFDTIRKGFQFLQTQLADRARLWEGPVK